MQKSTFKFILKLCLLVYLVCLFWLLFIKVGSTDRSTYFINPDDHFIPFHSTANLFRDAHKYHFHGQPAYTLVSNILGNIVLFVPWGLLGPLVFKKLNQFKWFILSALLISFFAEVIQYIFSIGIFDSDDIIYNSIGAVAGFLVLQCFKWLYVIKRKKYV